MDQGSTAAFKNPKLTDASDAFIMALARISLRMTAGRAADRPSISSVVNELVLEISRPEATADNVYIPNLSALLDSEEAKGSAQLKNGAA